MGMETAQIIIDGKACSAEPGEFLLSVARRNGIDIPTLCHHDALPGQASCRLCLVEVKEHDTLKIVVSCVYPVTDGLEVTTDSAKIKRLRKNVLRLLKERAPMDDRLDALCAEYGAVTDERFMPEKEEKCVMCGLCTRACSAIGSNAISTAMRGIFKKVSPPFDEPSPECVGCGSCARICPADAISLIETPDTRTIWGKTFELLKCTRCGRPYATPEEVDFLMEKGVITSENGNLCLDCRKIAAIENI